MKRADTVRGGRVILGATCFADAEAALEVAVVLAKRANAELHGLLVADEAIFAALETAHALTITYSGQTMRVESAEAMRSAFRADAASFEQRLLEAARAASLAHAFTQASGRMARAAAEIAKAGDLLIYGFHRPKGGDDSLVLILGDPGQGQSMALAGELMAALGRPLTVFVPPGAEPAARKALARHGIAGATVETAADQKAMLARLDRMRPAAVLLAPGWPETLGIERLVEAARAPVIVQA